MGHEVVGTIVEAGSEVKKFQVGDVVISPFSVSCGMFTHPFASFGCAAAPLIVLRCPGLLLFLLSASPLTSNSI